MSTVKSPDGRRYECSSWHGHPNGVPCPGCRALPETTATAPAYTEILAVTHIDGIPREVLEAAAEILVRGPVLVHRLRAAFPDLDEHDLQWVMPEDAPLPPGSTVRGISVVHGGVDGPVLGVKVRAAGAR